MLFSNHGRKFAIGYYFLKSLNNFFVFPVRYENALYPFMLFFGLLYRCLYVVTIFFDLMVISLFSLGFRIIRHMLRLAIFNKDFYCFAIKVNPSGRTSTAQSD